MGLKRDLHILKKLVAKGRAWAQESERNEAIVLGALAIGAPILGYFLIQLWQITRLPDPVSRISNLQDWGKSAVQLFGAVAAVCIVYVSWKRLKVTEETLKATIDGQVTQRYIDGVNLFSKDDPILKLAGLYALERIAHDSEKDHGIIFELLASFLRSTRKWVRPDPNQPSQLRRPGVDNLTQAILEVIGRRNVNFDRKEEIGINLSEVDISGATLLRANLSGMYFRYSNLEDCKFIDCDLSKAHFDKAILPDAKFYGVDLRSATFVDANLSGAHLLASDLRGADLSYARLNHSVIGSLDLFPPIVERIIATKLLGAITKGADFSGAHFMYVDLRGVDLSEAVGLESLITKENIQVDEKTMLPPSVSFESS